MEQIIDRLAEYGYAVIPNFISREEAIAIRDAAVSFKEDGEFKKAGIGKMHDFTISKDVRGDQILWIDEEHRVKEVDDYLLKVEDLMSLLNRTCFLGLKAYESHFAVYPVGAHYERHVDRFRTNPHRIVSFVLYLNPDWGAEDGGELMIYREGEDDVQVIPEAGKLVVFKSDLEHEVLTAHRSRYSITGWFLDVPVGLTFL